MEAVPASAAEESSSMPPAKRTRKKTGKSRQGCSQCKLRRVKCDEARPSCGNCTKLGFNCPGFHRQLRWSKKHERLFPTTSPIESPDSPRNNHHDAGSDGGQMPEFRQTSLSYQTTSPLGFLDTEYDHLFPGPNTCWLAAPPTPWGLTTSTSDSWQDDTTVDDATGVTGRSQGLPLLSEPVFGSTLGLFQTPAHMPTVLIEYWFRSVCPMWSAFDSEVNFNRQIAWNTWAISEAVFYAMQAMSAVCLGHSMPSLMEMLPSLRAQATAAIDLRMAQVRRSQQPTVTRDLVFAVLAFGTSLHWSSPADLVLLWLAVMRDLLSTWQVHLPASDAPFHAYFCQALSYWEMLLAGWGRGTIPVLIGTKRKQRQARLHQALHLPGACPDIFPDGPMPFDPKTNHIGTRPNSWCGISIEVIDTFGEVLALCRRAYRRERHDKAFNLATSRDALCDISLAFEIQRELLAMDFVSIVSNDEAQGFPVQTQDRNTPISHLLQTADAYRWAALLQLHLAFGDLPLTPSNRATTRPAHLLEMALKTLSILEQIPAESGSRSIHAMLYLSAAAGLKFDECSTSAADSHTVDVADFLEPSPLQMDLLPHSIGNPLVAGPRDNVQRGSDSMPVSGLFITTSNLEVDRGRRFVGARLGALQQSMPQRATEGMVQLVKDIWLKDDTSPLGCHSLLWLHLLEKSGPGVVF